MAIINRKYQTYFPFDRYYSELTELLINQCYRCLSLSKALLSLTHS